MMLHIYIYVYIYIYIIAERWRLDSRSGARFPRRPLMLSEMLRLHSLAVDNHNNVSNSSSMYTTTTTTTTTITNDNSTKNSNSNSSCLPGRPPAWPAALAEGPAALLKLIYIYIYV